MFNSYKDFFNNYVSDYDKSTWGINLKYNHTFRVVNNCEAIAKSLNLSNNDIELAKIIGLFHDIGRFYQYKKYNKLSDIGTIDHADLGVRVLKENSILKDNPNEDIIFKAILNHNKFEIEDNLSEREKLFCNIIRDADKLDIWELAIKKEATPAKYQGVYSKKVIDTLLNGISIRLIDYDEKIDRSLGYLGMFFDISFDYTKKYIKKHKILDLLIDQYIESNKQEEKNLLKIKEVIKERLCI